MEALDSTDGSLELVQRALRGEVAASRALVLQLTPIVQRRVAVAWASCGAPGGRPVSRSDVLDLTQQVLLLLFEREGRVLRSWDPERGLSLRGFVGLVAEREALTLLRTGRRSAWAETPTSDDVLDQAPAPGVEPRLSARDELSRIWEALECRLSPRGLALFRALLVDELPIEEVALRFGMSTGALYTFRSRLREQVQRLRGELAELGAPRRSLVALHEGRPRATGSGPRSRR
jgi:DNA-directed RNA polymerase specialized sigma24 family protein